MKIPIMLAQYLEDVGKNPEKMSQDELLDDALYVRNLDKQGEWWGFSMFYTQQTDKAQRAQLTRFIKKLSA